jgi:hypothetical protein
MGYIDEIIVLYPLARFPETLGIIHLVGYGIDVSQLD